MKHASCIVISLLAIGIGLTAHSASAQGGPRPALEMLRSHLSLAPESRPDLETQVFADLPLDYRQSQMAMDALWSDALQRIRDGRAEEWRTKSITIDGRTMKFDYRVFGEPGSDPATGEPRGRSLFISMHGGGNAAPEVNEKQWQNQIRLYEPEEGVYLAPRAPTDTWNLWHEPHIDGLFDRIIADAVAFENVDPDRVYLMGYSAGGDGVYQLAPRMADRFAAAAMMAGHPNEAQPQNLRNLPFAIHMGANDSAYDRNKVAAAWGEKLDELRASDPDGYVHVAKLHEGKGHWMDREDAEAVAWMSGFTRDPWPDRVVWRQDDVTHTRLYWLSIPVDARVAGATLAARFENLGDDQTITIETASGFGDRRTVPVTILLSDKLLNLDRPIIIRHGEAVLYQGLAFRTIRPMAASLRDRADRAMMPTASITIDVPVAPQGQP